MHRDWLVQDKAYALRLRRTKRIIKIFVVTMARYYQTAGGIQKGINKNQYDRVAVTFKSGTRWLPAVVRQQDILKSWEAHEHLLVAKEKARNFR